MRTISLQMKYIHNVQVIEISPLSFCKNKQYEHNDLLLLFSYYYINCPQSHGALSILYMLLFQRNKNLAETGKIEDKYFGFWVRVSSIVFSNSISSTVLTYLTFYCLDISNILA